jgi:hypothetical protein
MLVPGIRFAKPQDLEELLREPPPRPEPPAAPRRPVAEETPRVEEIKRIRSGTPESLAAEDLKTAMRHFLSDRLSEAEQCCQQIIAEYPRTQAGREAKQLLSLIAK